MKCQRCRANEARYRVYTEVMNTKVCTSCALVALELGITVVDLEDGKQFIGLATLEKVQIFVLFEPDGWGTV